MLVQVVFTKYGFGDNRLEFRRGNRCIGNYRFFCEYPKDVSESEMDWIFEQLVSGWYWEERAKAEAERNRINANVEVNLLGRRK